MTRSSRWSRVALGGVAAVVAASIATPVIATHNASVQRPVVTPPVDPAIVRQIAKDAAAPMRAFVHADTTAHALAAARSHHVTVTDRWDAVNVAVVEAPARALPALVRSLGVSRVEADAPARYMTDTSHKATRSREARDVFKTVPLPDKNGQVPTGSTKVRYAYPPTIDGHGISIAIVDSGIDGTHPMLTRPDGTSKVARNLKLACHGLLTDGDGGCGVDHDSLWVDMTDVNDTDTPSMGGHGTHVASTAGGVDYRISPTRLLSGAAPGANLIGLSVGQTINVYAGASGLLWVLDHHADPCGNHSCPPIRVVNNSWGPVVVGSEYNPNDVVSKIQDKLVAAGVTVVWSNGNGDTTGNGGNGSDVRSSVYGQSPTPGIISVANYDDKDSGTREGTIDPSSSRGQSGKTATYPDISAPGTNITAACRPYLAVCNSGELNYGTISGTSMAAPHISGIVAQMLQVKPTLSPAQIEDIIEDTAHKFHFGAPYEPDLPARNDGTTSFDKGHGLVDATAAIARILGVPTPPADAAVDPYSACKADGPVMTDPTGDATEFASANGVPNEPGLDITELRLATSGENLSATFTLDDLKQSPPLLGLGASIETQFTYGSATLEISVKWANGGQPTADFGVTSGLTGSYQSLAKPTPVLDYNADTITVTVPFSVFSPPLAKGVVLQRLLRAHPLRRQPDAAGPAGRRHHRHPRVSLHDRLRRRIAASR